MNKYYSIRVVIAEDFDQALEKICLELFDETDLLNDEILTADQLLSKATRLETEEYCAVIWSVEDFKQRAKERKRKKWKQVYDKSKFYGALDIMCNRKHDASLGVNWDTIDYYLDEYCRFDNQTK